MTSPHLAPTSPRLLVAEEVAQRLSVPTSWVRAETRAGRMPHVKLGRYRRYDWDAVVAWLEEQRSGQWRKHRPQVAAAIDNTNAAEGRRRR